MYSLSSGFVCLFVCQDGDRFWRIPECYVRGSNIKYLRIPDEVLHSPTHPTPSKPTQLSSPHPTPHKYRTPNCYYDYDYDYDYYS